MQTEILIAAASIIVTFIVATWRWSASQIKRFDQMMVGVQNEVDKLRDDNNRLRSEVRGDIKEVREDVHKLDNSDSTPRRHDPGFVVWIFQRRSHFSAGFSAVNLVRMSSS